MTQKVDGTVEQTWSTGGEADIKQELISCLISAYEVNFGAGSVGVNTTLSYTGFWGEDNTKSRTVTVGTTSSILTDVPQGESVIASFIGTQGTV